jgi:hypothetical protein
MEHIITLLFKLIESTGASKPLVYKASLHVHIRIAIYSQRVIAVKDKKSMLEIIKAFQINPTNKNRAALENIIAMLHIQDSNKNYNLELHKIKSFK